MDIDPKKDGHNPIKDGHWSKKKIDIDPKKSWTLIQKKLDINTKKVGH